MTLHVLKTWPEYFDAVWRDEKPFEVRRADRDFAVGDLLSLCEYDPSEGYSGRVAAREVTYILEGGNFGIEPGFVVMGLKKPSPEALEIRPDAISTPDA